MSRKNVVIPLIIIIGVYFLLFHTDPFPFNHEAIGLPPYHVIHAVFGGSLLVLAGYLWHKK